MSDELPSDIATLQQTVSMLREIRQQDIEVINGLIADKQRLQAELDAERAKTPPPQPLSVPTTWGIFTLDGRFTNLVGENEEDAQLTGEDYFTKDFIVRPLYKTPAPAELSTGTVADFARRLFDLHGFMLLETYNGKHAVTVTFPDLQEAQQFHGVLVELSTHRPRPQSLAEYAASRAAIGASEVEG